MDAPSLVLDPSVRLERGDGRMRLRRDGIRALDVDLGEDLGDAFAEGLRAGMALEPLVATVGQDFMALTRARVLVAGLARVDAIALRLDGPDGPLAELRPAPPSVVLGGSLTIPAVVRLSRFATLSRDGRAIVLRSPLVDGVLILHEPAAAAALLGGEVSADRAGVAALAAAAGFLASEAEDTDPDLAAWEPHDLAFHRRSRIGAHGGGIGPTHRLGEAVEPAPLRRAPGSGPRIALPRPASALQPGLGLVLERRRSRRDHADAPIPLETLGALLHHALRVRRIGDEGGEEIAWRPFPSAGGRHPLEVYLCVDRVEGVPRGIHRYDPFDHALETMDAPDGALDRLLADARIGSGTPALALSIAARFRRTTHKYESIAYALILKDAAVMMQTLHLVATALDLASCMVGTGDPRRLATAIGTEVHAESSVAEMILGLPVDRETQSP